MSSTNRGGQRAPSDFYATPAWCVHRLLEACELPGGAWLEPCAGDGAIIRAVAAAGRADVRWTAAESRAECAEDLRRAPGVERVSIQDFTKEPRWHDFEVVITNPPFFLADRIIDRALASGNVVVMLLRLNYLASAKRSRFMRSRTPDVYVLPNRPSFTGGKTDSIEYAWFVWKARAARAGTIRVLAETDPEVRSSRGASSSGRATTSHRRSGASGSETRRD